MAEVRPIRLPVQSRERRSHAERTAETRARVIEAVFASIAEVGFARTTASEITRRAGVTWGAVQHHFGGKHGLVARWGWKFVGHEAGIKEAAGTMKQGKRDFLCRLRS